MDNEITRNPEAKKTSPVKPESPNVKKINKVRKPRGFKIALVVILALLFVCAAALFFLPHFIPSETIQSIVNSRAKDYGLKVGFTKLGFSWDGKVVLEGVSVAPLGDDGVVGDSILEMDEVRTNVAVSPLLQGKIVINSLDVNGFSARLVRAADGSLNLPDFSRFAALSRPIDERGGKRLLLASAAVAPAASGIPPIEIHQVNLNDGLLSVDDEITNLALEIGLDFLNIRGAGLNDPFSLAGRLLPYPGAADKGEIPFTGRVAMLKDMALDPDGEATFEAEIKSFALDRLAAKLGYGHLLKSGVLDGIVKAAYAEGKGRVAVSEMKLAGAEVALDAERVIAVPDSTLGVNAEFDPGPGALAFSDLSILNDLNSLKANGWVRDIYGLADGIPPTAAVEFSGVADFAGMIAFAEALHPGLAGLPRVAGGGSYFGNAALAEREAGNAPIPVTLSVDFTDGALAVRDDATGVAADVKLGGIGVKAAATLSDTPEINANLAFKNVPVHATIPPVGDTPVSLAINGGLALNAAGEAAAVELRLWDTTASVPATPWATAMDLVCPETRLTYDLQSDRLDVAAMSFAVNNDVRGGVRAATVTGLLSGNPQGQADLEISTLLETFRKLFQPMMPDAAAKLAGSLRAVSRLRLDGRLAEARVQAEVDDADVQMNIEQLQVAAATSKTTVVLRAGVHLDNPAAVAVHAFEINNAESTLRAAEKGGRSLSGRFGVTSVKLAGVVDAAGMRGEFSDLSLAGNGMSVVIGQGARRIAGIESGVMRIVAAAGETPLQAPLSGTGEFNLRSLEVGMDNLVFYVAPAEGGTERQNSDFGNVRATLGVDGNLDAGQPRTINLRTATLVAKPFAANVRAQADLVAGALSAQYAARLMPAGMGPLLAYLQLPPTLLDQAAVSGVLAWNGAQFDSKGNAQGQLRLASGEINPFEMVHDLSAAYQPERKSLTVAIRRLDGNVKTGSGEAAVTLAAQPSNLLLSRTGSKGLLDIRLNGAAGPTRTLVLGLIGMLPQLREFSDALHKTRVDGVYNAWLQVRDNDSSSIGVNLGGIWQGAALQFDNVPCLAEAGKLSAALEGEFAHRENRISVSRLLLRSDSAAAQGDGSAQALLATDADHNIIGVASLGVDLRFLLGDLSKLALTFPGVVPSDMGLTGRAEGALKAGGDANDIRVSEGVARFQGVRLTPGGVEVAVMQGAADFGAVISLVPRTPANLSGSPYDVFRLFNIRNGQASLTGAQIQGRAVETMTGAFELDDGVLNLRNARISLQGQDGGAIAASGTVDFKAPAPAVNLQTALRNVPLSLANQEIAQYFEVESGVINLPVEEGGRADLAFSGFSEDEILRTLRVGNFNFATGPVIIQTGPLLNTELDKARGLMRQEVTESGRSRRISLKSITGVATAEGNGLIVIPPQNPIVVVGDNTGDFRVQGSISADHTMDLEFFITGKLENIIGFTLPNLIPNLRQGTDEQKNRFMQRLNQNAAKGNYSVRLSGPLDRPDLSGIGQLALRFMTDIFAAAPSEIIGGVVNLGKDAPGALLDAAGAILNPENVTNPSNIINAPKNLGRTVGRMFGIGGDQGGDQGGEGESGEGR